MKRVKKREQRGELHLLLTDDSQKIRHFLEIKLKVYVTEVLLIISHVHEKFDTTNSFLSMQQDLS